MEQLVISLKQMALAGGSGSQADSILESLPLPEYIVLSSGRQLSQADVNASAEHGFDRECRISSHISLFLKHEKITKTVSVFVKRVRGLLSQRTYIFTYLFIGM